MSHKDSVREFYTGFQQEEFVAKRASLDPTNIAPERLHLKLALIAEEFIELIEAAYGPASGELLKTAWLEAQAADQEVRDLVEVADAVADLDYVLQGLAIEVGIPSDEIFEVVHESNMSKLGEDGKPVISDGVTPSAYDGLVKPKGKIVKGPNYFEATPEIVRILDEAK
jgi:predicted HAD superfamily Cof-like phosphohydrolase